MATVIIEKLGEFFSTELTGVTRSWMAAALVNDKGFTELQDSLSKGVIQQYLIGIDLPTPVPLLKKIQLMVTPGLFEAKLSKNDNGSFHPKVYLFEFTDGSLKAIAGSGNLTSGGLTDNVEMNVLVDDKAICDGIKNWFTALFNDAFPLDDENIRRYEERWLAYQPASDALKKMQRVTLQKPVMVAGPLDNINFSDRYFKKEHHLAFSRDRWFDTDKQADAGRKAVADVFTTLHQDIYKQFGAYELKGLYPNTNNHLVSMFYHAPDRQKQKLDAMWLSYGKSEEEIKKYHKEYRQPYLPGQNQEDDKQSFINHARLQIRIEFQEIGIWILFAKNNGGGLIDRNIFIQRMRSEPAYRTKFYLLLKELPEPYWISVANDSKNISWFTDEDTLYNFCKKDTDEYYFIIGRDYAITDPEMSAENLPGEVLKVFSLLYPLYRHMRHYL